jgi:hypothetical protein
MGRTCSTNGEKNDVYRLVLGKAERNNYEEKDVEGNNIKMDLGEIGWDIIDWLVWLRIGTGGGLL